MRMNNYMYLAVMISVVSILGYKYIIDFNLEYMIIGIVLFLSLKGLSDSGYLNKKVIFSYNDSFDAIIRSQKTLGLEEVFRYISISSKNMAKKVGGNVLPIDLDELYRYICSNSVFRYNKYGLKEELEYALDILSSKEKVWYVQNVISPNQKFNECVTRKLAYNEVISSGTLMFPKGGGDILDTNNIVVLGSKNFSYFIKNFGNIYVIPLSDRQKIEMLNRAMLPYKNNGILLNGILSGRVRIR